MGAAANFIATNPWGGTEVGQVGLPPSAGAYTTSAIAREKGSVGSIRMSETYKKNVLRMWDYPPALSFP